VKISGLDFTVMFIGTSVQLSRPTIFPRVTEGLLWWFLVNIQLRGGENVVATEVEAGELQAEAIITEERRYAVARD
jgi:hypothetical protein